MQSVMSLPLTSSIKASHYALQKEIQLRGNDPLPNQVFSLPQSFVPRSFDCSVDQPLICQSQYVPVKFLQPHIPPSFYL